MGEHAGKPSDSDEDGNDCNEGELAHTKDNSHHVGFDQLINEDSDDDVPLQTMNTSKTNVASSLFMTSRPKEQQYEHFQDSDDDDDNDQRKHPSGKTSSSKFPMASERDRRPLRLERLIVETLTWF